MEEEEIPLGGGGGGVWAKTGSVSKAALVSGTGLLSDDRLWIKNTSSGHGCEKSVSSFAMAAFGARFFEDDQDNERTSVSRKRPLKDCEEEEEDDDHHHHHQQQHSGSRRLQFRQLQQQQPKRNLGPVYMGCVNGKDCWHDIEHEMGTEFLSAEEARLAFKNYARIRLFPPACLTPTVLACRVFECPFRIRLIKDEKDDDGNFEVDRGSSSLAHIHAPEIPKEGRIYARSNTASSKDGGDGGGKPRTKIRVRESTKKHILKKTDVAKFAAFSIACTTCKGGGGDEPDAWDIRRAWLDRKRNDGRLPGLGSILGPAFASTVFFDSPGCVIPGYQWMSVRKKNKLIRGRQAHFLPDHVPSRKLTKEARSVVRTERMTMDEMAMELSSADFAYLKWWLDNAENPAHLLRVIGTSAFDLEHTCMELQYAHSVFGSLNNHNGDGARQHAIFVGRGESREGGFHVDNVCYMAIDVYALISLRLESLVYIPLHMRMPGPPVLIQAWAQRPGDRDLNQETRLHAMSATLNFFIQHLTQDQNRTKKWVYPIGSPAFSIYDMLPEFLELLRNGADTRILSLLRESVIDGVFVDNRESITQSILAFIAQKQDHLITRRMYNKLLLIFDNEPDVRTMHPVVNSLFRHFRHHPTLIHKEPEATRVDFYISKWTEVEFESHVKRFRPTSEEIRPHHFFYLLCFDTLNFSKQMRADIASSLTIDDFSPKTGLNELHHPSFNFCKRVETTDRIYTPEFRDYLKHCAIQTPPPMKKPPGPGNIGGGGSRSYGSEEADMCFYSSDLRDAWPLNGMYLTMASLQHLSWNPPVPYSVADLNPNLVHEEVPLAVLNPRLNVDNSFSNVRLEDPGSFAVQGNHDLPVARTMVFSPSAENPRPRPFPRQQQQQQQQAKKKAKILPRAPQQGKGPVIKLRGEGRASFIKEEDVIYMSEFLLSTPLKNRPSDANVLIEELDAYLLVRDPLYLQRKED